MSSSLMEWLWLDLMSLVQYPYHIRSKDLPTQGTPDICKASSFVSTFWLMNLVSKWKSFVGLAWLDFLAD